MTKRNKTRRNRKKRVAQANSQTNTPGSQGLVPQQKRVWFFGSILKNWTSLRRRGVRGNIVIGAFFPIVIGASFLFLDLKLNGYFENTPVHINAKHDYERKGPSIRDIKFSQETELAVRAFLLACQNESVEKHHLNSLVAALSRPSNSDRRAHLNSIIGEFYSRQEQYAEAIVFFKASAVDIKKGPVQQSEIIISYFLNAIDGRSGQLVKKNQTTGLNIKEQVELNDLTGLGLMWKKDNLLGVFQDPSLQMLVKACFAGTDGRLSRQEFEAITTLEIRADAIRRLLGEKNAGQMFSGEKIPNDLHQLKRLSYKLPNRFDHVSYKASSISPHPDWKRFQGMVCLLAGVEQLPNLRHLVIEGQDLHSFDMTLENLETLEIRDTKLLTFEIQAPHLQKLILENNFGQGESRVAPNPALWSTDLTELTLNEIDPRHLHFDHLTLLNSLTLKRNNMDSLMNLPTSLRKLDLAGNHFNVIPQLPQNLRELYMDNNPLKDIHTLPPGLIVLYANNCSLTRIEDWPNSLTEIDIGNNRLRQIPELHDGLEVLNVCKNDLKNLPNWPTSLKKLDISSNSLRLLPADFFENRPNMNLLNLRNNDFSEGLIAELENMKKDFEVILL